MRTPTNFFQRMQEIDKKVAKVLNDMHTQQTQRANLARRDQVPFVVGDVVWYRRPPKSGDKLDSRWIGPGTVVAREGESSYEIEIKPGVTMKAPRTFLKL